MVVKMILINKIIRLIFLILLETIIVLNFFEPTILNIFPNKIYFESYLM